MEEKIYYDSTDGIKLCGLLSKANDADSIAILCHGLKADKTVRGSFTKLTERLRENGINSFRFDFRGHGESGGHDYDMTPTKEVEDLESTIQMLANKGYHSFVLLGESFGASIISLLDTDKIKSIKALVSWYGCLDYFATIEEEQFFSDEHMRIAKENGYYELISKRTGRPYRIGYKLFEEIHSITPYEKLVKKDIPILFIHGLEDKMIPYTLSEKVSRMCANASLVLIKNGDHTFSNDTKALADACDATVSFIKDNIYA